MESINWTTIGLLSALIPILAVPLALLSQYFKGLHEYHVQRGNDLIERLNRLADEVAQVSQMVHDFEKHYTRKEDWQRELLQQRSDMDTLTTLVTSIQIELKKMNGKT